MDMEYGVDCTMILISVNGAHQKLRDTECIRGKMVTDMKENGNAVLNMDKELISLLMEIFTQVNTKMVNQMAKVNILGKTDLFT